MKDLNRTGRALMYTGAAFVLAYTLLSLRGASPRLVSLGGILFYVGAAAVIVGAALRVASKGARR